MSRRIIRGNDVAIATRAFDDWAHPPALLIMRGMASMQWWPERFCRRPRNTAALSFVMAELARLLISRLSGACQSRTAV
ncbi:hypothetical protein CN151_32860 [Sinorhizobium meliloti]|nr:hypothetical protein C770_GR4pC0409 [Sinorhizobium meliloti GR4]RVK33790.1 hypothetical protein CN163_23280 [Sinorhizobium meliloti]RVK91953.1 hypothetical protein CN151_32860 [Sinorhizobium meliloti]RVM97050.1 hypothetical protein CN119_05110 [Sinorhizobium meliloti]RVN00375.1 hypothetical protein CN112_33315 [Sinorhizobium meliloti]